MLTLFVEGDLLLQPFHLASGGLIRPYTELPAHHVGDEHAHRLGRPPRCPDRAVEEDR